MASGYLNGDKYAPLVNEWNQQIVTLQPTWSKFCNVRNDKVIALQNYADITPAALASSGSAATTPELSQRVVSLPTPKALRVAPPAGQAAG